MHPQILQGTVEEATAWVFGPQGPIQAQGYEVRESQKALALSVARRIDAGNGWVLGEAPCGTGKGLAYLIPGIIAALRAEQKWNRGDRPEGETAFRKLVVSTANIALQGQLMKKDVPAVGRLLGVEVKAALYKGRNNFLCLSKVEDLALAFPIPHATRRLIDWSREESCTGDKDDLDFDASSAWWDLSVGSDECHGKKCPYYRGENGKPLCFAERARVGMGRAHVVIVNHHLLSLHRPIPSVFLAVDEGHELESCVRSAHSGQISNLGAAALARRVANVLDPVVAKEKVEEPLTDLIDKVPFDPPDPLEEAVSTLLAQKSGGSKFGVRALPKACMTLAQAAGRLIRAQSDLGAVVVLDGRVTGGPMSQTLRSALPPFPLSRNLQDVGNVLDRKPLSVQPVRAGSVRRTIPAQPAK